MNKRGFGLSTLMVFILILMICLVIIYILVERNFSNILGTNYSKYEQRVVLALKKYKNNNSIKLENNEQRVITIKELKKDNLLKDFECTGYGIYKIENNKNVYQVYINCGTSYVTDGYLKYLDEF